MDRRKMFLAFWGVMALFVLGCMARPAAASKTSGDAVALASSSFDIQSLDRTEVLIGSLTVFVLAVFVGFEVIAKVPPTLHTPLMSGSNAISGITVVGALLAAGAGSGWVATIGMMAVALAMVNVVGGFVVTHRMLSMFCKR